ncbi:MAG: PD-(D/E)XK nuclease family protein [Planctomycetes bacterium]|nr:PD-(D/E)XK nuclease family protein [Planctomycetota bacterium]
MAKLVNELSWSRTRMSTLKTCLRSYYYQYYLKWDGWSWDAPDDRKKAYFLSKMSNLPMLIGHAVHETIKRILTDLKRQGRLLAEDYPFFARKEVMTPIWTEACRAMDRFGRERIWQQSPKKAPPMFELYYGPRPEPEALKEVGARVADAVRTFLELPLFAELVADDKSRWIAIDPEPSFDDDTKHRINGRTIWALPDFARENAAGECEIWDWKTGSKSPNDELQLLSYALYARDKLGFPADRIRLFGCYLKDGEIAEYPCDADRLAFIEAEIERDFEIMLGLLSDQGGNVPRTDLDQAFPLIEAGSTCRACFFRELCGR